MKRDFDRRSEPTERPQERPANLCIADGCPRLWAWSDSLGAGGRGLCTHHGRADPHRWPEISERLRYADSIADERANHAPAPRLSPQDKVDMLNALRGLFRRTKPDHHKAWARDLRAREEAGEQLTQYQRDAWREALRAADQVLSRAHLEAAHDA